MRGFFKLAFSVSILSLVAFSAPACGGDDDDGGTGGTAATGGGGTGGTTSDAGVTCGTNTCTGWKVGGLIAVAPCCAGAAQDKCGGLVDKTLSGLMGFPEGCYETDQPGKVDCGCPNHVGISPLDNKPFQYNGCCSTTGKCGYNVDITSKAGPNFGCAPLTTIGGPDIPCTVGSEIAPPPNADGGTDYCPNPDAGTGGTAGAGGAAGGGGTAGAATDAGTD